MYPFLRIGRRKFLRDSALGLGVAPLIPGLSSAESAGAEQKPGGPAPNSTALTMRATFGGEMPVWIVREPHAGFQEQWASRELARGLRNLGLAREPVQAVAGEGELPSSGLVFSLSTSRREHSGILKPTKSRTNPAPVKPRGLISPAPRRRRFSTACLIFWSGKGRSLDWMARFTLWSLRAL